MHSKKEFQKIIYTYYRNHGREMPWRAHITPYRIVVSEIMLQQTQVSRVIEKYNTFIKTFPNWKSLATASQADVITAWQGLGYNRRALFLHRMAKIIVEKYKGKLPSDEKELQKLPGIGVHTAGSICAFAFNMSTTFIETNIRSVYIHHFFSDARDVSDKEIYPYVKEMCDEKNPREWYWALMDYGTMLKKEVGNPNKKSKHYSVQKKFEGSHRQIRGAIIKLLTKRKKISQEELSAFLKREHKTSQKAIKEILEKLIDEKFIIEQKGIIKFL